MGAIEDKFEKVVRRVRRTLSIKSRKRRSGGESLEAVEVHADPQDFISENILIQLKLEKLNSQFGRLGMKNRRLKEENGKNLNTFSE